VAVPAVFVKRDRRGVVGGAEVAVRIPHLRGGRREFVPEVRLVVALVIVRWSAAPATAVKVVVVVGQAATVGGEGDRAGRGHR